VIKIETFIYKLSNIGYIMIRKESDYTLFEKYEPGLQALTTGLRGLFRLKVDGTSGPKLWTYSDSDGVVNLAVVGCSTKSTPIPKGFMNRVVDMHDFNSNLIDSGGDVSVNFGDPNSPIITPDDYNSKSYIQTVGPKTFSVVESDEFSPFVMWEGYASSRRKVSDGQLRVRISDILEDYKDRIDDIRTHNDENSQLLIKKINSIHNLETGVENASNHFFKMLEDVYGNSEDVPFYNRAILTIAKNLSDLTRCNIKDLSDFMQGHDVPVDIFMNEDGEYFPDLYAVVAVANTGITEHFDRESVKAYLNRMITDSTKELQEVIDDCAETEIGELSNPSADGVIYAGVIAKEQQEPEKKGLFKRWLKK